MQVHAKVAEIATRHHGVVSRRLLREAGLSGNTIDRWLRAGSVEVVVPGIYRLFSGDDELQRVTVAVLALRHSAADLETAAWLHGLRVEHSDFRGSSCRTAGRTVPDWLSASRVSVSPPVAASAGGRSLRSTRRPVIDVGQNGL